MSGDLKKRRMWPTMLCCALVKPQERKNRKAVSREDLDPVQLECTEPAMACAACLEGGIRLERRSTAVTIQLLTS